MEETVIMNEAQPVNNENNNETKSSYWRQVVIGGVSGIALGSAATVAMAAMHQQLAASSAETEDVAEGEVTFSDVDDAAEVVVAADVDESVQVAQVSDDMSFGEAFASAHDQVGPGGVFVWHGQLYGTYTADEWNSMTPEEHAEYGSRVRGMYYEVLASSSSSAEHDGASYVQQQQDIHVEDGDPTEGASATEVSGEPEIEVLDFDIVTNDDGSQMDVAVVSVDDQVMGVYDIDQDGIADCIAQDANNDGEITANEIADISDEGISMQVLHDDYLAATDPSMQGPDYVNDGNIESYMA